MSLADDWTLTEADRIYQLLKDNVLAIKPDCMMKIVGETKEDEKGKKELRKRTFADWLANARAGWEIWRGNLSTLAVTERWTAANSLMKAFGYGDTWRFFEVGEGYVFKMEQQENLVKNLSQDIERLTKERDTWKRMYDECDAGEAFTGNVEEPK